MDPAASNGLIGVAVIAAFLCFGFIIPFYVKKGPKRSAAGGSSGDAGVWLGTGNADSCDTGSHSGASCDSGGGDGGGGGGD
jgi:hypothetical protein